MASSFGRVLTRFLLASLTALGALAMVGGLPSSPAAAIEHPPIDLDTLNMVPKRGWGVSGQTPQNTQTETLDVLVYDMVQSGDNMYVGGAFLNVQNGRYATPIRQNYLAAFNVYTGEWVDTFRPTFDRAIYALEVLPNGSILVGGEFERVNGTTRRGLVAIDRDTGQIDASFPGAVDRPWSGRRATVRDMKVEPTGEIYVAGNFSHLEGAGGSRTQVGKAGKFSNDKGVLDATWKPYVAGGAVWGLDTDPSRGEVALSGFFTSVNGEFATGHFHVVDDSTGATKAGKRELVRNLPGVQPEIWDVVYGDDIIFAIGEQHTNQVLDADTHEMIGYHITGSIGPQFEWPGFLAGGAYQAGERIGDIMFIGCHCTNAANNHYDSFTGRRTTRHNVMAYDAKTGRHLEKFWADVDSPRDGHWAAASDTAGCLWIGGDYHVGGNDAGSPRWLGGFARLCTPLPLVQIDNLVDQGSELGQPVAFTPEVRAGGATLSFSATGLPAGLSIDAATGEITGTPTQTELATVTITADVPNKDAIPLTKTIQWAVLDGTAPVLEAIDRTVVVGSKQLDLDPFATDDEGFPFVWSATGLPQGASIDGATGAIRGVPADGTFQVTVTVTDMLGLSDSESFELVVVEAGGVTAITNYADYSSSGGSYFMGWQFTVTEELDISELGAHDTNRNGKLDNGNNTTVGLYQKNNRRLLARVDIPANTTPENGFAYATLDNPITLTPGTTYIIAAEHSGEPWAYNGNITFDDNIEYKGYAYKGGSNIGWPNNQGTSKHFYFGGTFRTISDPTPVLSGVGDQASKLGAELTLNIDATVADGLTPVYTATGLPNGLSVDSATGEITGTPTTEGSYTVAVKVIDDIGLSDTERFTWLIVDADGPTLTPIDDLAILETNAVDITVTANDDAGQGLTYTATGLPNGLTINADNNNNNNDKATITGTAEPGTYQITVTATDILGLQDSESFELVVVEAGGVTAITNYRNYSRSGGNYFMGWQFTVTEELDISELGAHDTNRNGKLDNNGATTVGLYQKNNQKLLARVNIPANTTPEDGFAYAELADPVTLTPGTTYIIAAEHSGEPWAYEGNITFGDNIEYEGYAYKGGSNIGWPNNQGTSKHFYFGGTFRTVNDPTPVLSGVGDQASKLGAELTLNIDATVADGLTPTYTATGLPNGLAIDSSTGEIAGTPDTEGSYTVAVKVTDDIGLTDTETFTWLIVDADGPTLTPIDDLAILETNAVDITITANDDAGQGLTYTATGLPNGLKITADNNGNGNIAGKAAPGTYQITVTATDILGLTDTTTFQLISVKAAGVTAITNYRNYSRAGGDYFMGWQFTVTEELDISELGAHDTNRDGRITNRGVTTAALYEKNSRQLLARVDIPADATPEDGFAYAKLDNPITVKPGTTYIVAAEVSGEQYAYSGNITFDDNIEYKGYAYKNGRGIGYPSSQSTSKHYYFGGTFRTINDPTPVLSDVGDQASKLNTELTLNIDATVADGLTPVYTATGLPNGLTIDSATGDITGTPTTEGSYTVAVKVTDDIGLTDTETFTWRVLDVNPPAITPIPNTGAVETDPISIQVEATDEAGGLTYAAAGLPQGTWITDSGLITGTPTSDGTFTVTVTVTDRAGLSATDTFTLEVANWDTLTAITDYDNFSSGNGSYFMGWQFTVTEEIAITELGVHDTNRNGRIDNNGATSAAVYNKDNRQLIGRVDIPADATPEDGFAYAKLANPVTVKPGTTYIVAAEQSGERWAYGGNITFDDKVEYQGYAYKQGSGVGWPNYQETSRHYYFGATFRVKADKPPVPNPDQDNNNDGGDNNDGDNDDGDNDDQVDDGNNGDLVTLVDFGSTWRYEDSGSDLGRTWRTVAYNDNNWATGAAKMGFGNDDEATTFTAGNVTYYTRTSFEFDGNDPAALSLDLQADDGAIVYLNGVEILRDNLPNGPIDFETTAETWRSGDDEEPKNHIVSADALRQGTNVVAVEIHNVWSRNNDLAFDLRLQAADQGAADDGPAQLIEAGSNWTHTDSANGEPANWKTGIQGGQTGSAEFGFGDDDEATTLTKGEDAYYFTRTFTVDDVDEITTLELGLAADDGAVVYVNGVEVTRVNMPDGQVTPETRPLTWVGGADEALKPYTVDPAALTAGTNVIAVEVHNLWRNNNDLSFDLYLIANP